MTFRLRTEPYYSRVTELLKKDNSKLIKTADGDGRIDFSWEEVYNIAKATGLKSKKQRHIIKRFRIFMYEAVRCMLEEHKNGRT